MSEPIKVLVIEHDQNDAGLISRMVDEANGVAFDVSHADQPSAGLRSMENNPVDIILFSLDPSDGTGFKALTSLCTYSSDVPVVALAWDDFGAIGDKVVREGAQDYLDKKRLNPEMLSRVIRYSIERKRSEQASRAHEAHFRRVLEKSTDAMVVYDRSGIVRFANPAAALLFDISLPDLQGSTLGLPLSRGESTEIEIPRSDGAMRVAEMSVVEMDWEGEEASLATLRDITRRKRAEETLREQAMELQRQNEELDAFSHTVAHDLRSPIGVIVGFSEVLEDHHRDMSGEEIREYLKLIVQAGFKMSSIVDELLVLAGVRKQADVETGALDMRPLIVEATRRLSGMIEEHQAEIMVPDAWPAVVGHGPWVEEVWVNYISNAVKHGGRPPRVELGSTIEKDGIVRFWTRDNGRGLNADEQSRIFAPFSRLNQATTKGHGLGLSIVARIMERLGGRTGVESEVGKGSTFFFSLPQPEE